MVIHRLLPPPVVWCGAASQNVYGSDAAASISNGVPFSRSTWLGLPSCTSASEQTHIHAHWNEGEFWNMPFVHTCCSGGHSSSAGAVSSFNGQNFATVSTGRTCISVTNLTFISVFTNKLCLYFVQEATDPRPIYILTTCATELLLLLQRDASFTVSVLQAGVFSCFMPVTARLREAAGEIVNS